MYKLKLDGGLIRLHDGAEIPNDADNPDYKVYLQWAAAGGSAAPAQVPSQLEIDTTRYARRARAKDQILAEFAAENMARVRAGKWSVPQLVGLTQDTGLKSLLDNIDTLSFEIAASQVPALTNPLLTQEIKAGWVSKLQAHFY